jgi:putative peptidoglycan binding protein/rare lipoprotein A (RlpA)-like double-psi beta-barrel protein
VRGRRSQTYSSPPGGRPDRVAAWAFALGIFLILVAATTSRGDSGGAAVPAPAQPAAQAQLGERVLREGSEGPDVRTLQSILEARGYGELQTSGTFDPATTAAVRRFQQEAGLQTDGVVGPETRPKLVALMRVRRATWYGPGLYGNRMACGGTLRRSTLGVAHKTLPCGTPVTFYHRGRFVTVSVIDRGPFRRGVEWDLTAAAAKALGMAATSRLRAIH